MRKVLTLVFLTVLAGHSAPLLTVAQENSVQERTRLEKEFQSDRELRPSSALTDTLSGTVDPQDSETGWWTRIFSSSSADPECGMGSIVSEFGRLPYAKIPIEVTQTENLEAYVVASGTTLEDTVLAVYCGPFNPDEPQQNLLAYDDDDGTGQLSAFSDADGVTLNPGQIYALVLSPFRGGTRFEWNYQIELTSATAAEASVPVELQSCTIE